MNEIKQKLIDNCCKNCCDYELCMGDRTYCLTVENILHMCDRKAEELSKMNRFRLIREIRKHNPRLKFFDVFSFEVCNPSSIHTGFILFKSDSKSIISSERQSGRVPIDITTISG